MMEELAKCQDGFAVVLLVVAVFALGFGFGYLCGKVEGIY